MRTILLGLALAFEPREPGIMRRPPRMPDTAILSGELIFRIVLVGLLLLLGSFGLFEWALYQGASEAEARTIAVNVFAVGQSFYLLNCRSLRFSMFRLGLFGNPWIWGGIAGMTVAQLLFTYKINPQTALYAGYSDNQVADDRFSLTRTDRTLFLKVGYAFVR